MDVILLERVAKLGQMGDEVRVKDGYARNFLLPRGKALRANKDNRERFEGQRAQLEARNLEAREEADRVREKLDGESFVVIRSAGETGQLYGSVSTRDIADALKDGGFDVSRQQVRLDQPIKTIGLQTIEIQLHPEVEAHVKLNVARSQDEAERQARGEDLTQRDAFFDEEDEEDLLDISVEEIFEQPEALDDTSMEGETSSEDDGAASHDNATGDEDQRT